jgi:hypothetical protein
MIVVTDPVTGESQSIDPSTRPGYYGDFKPKSETGAATSNAYFMGMSEDGSFTYDYKLPEDIIEQTITAENDNTDTSTLL